jgi:hypothetical protein
LLSEEEYGDEKDYEECMPLRNVDHYAFKRTGPKTEVRLAFDKDEHVIEAIPFHLVRGQFKKNKGNS